MKHCFVISAYGDCPYLEECIRSLKEQTVPSEVFLCTSTPSVYLEKLAQQYQLPFFVREGKSSLREDWNFCVDTALRHGAELLTIAHQDDVYLPAFAEEVKRNAGEGISLIFTAAENMDARGNQVPGKAESVKRILRLPLRMGFGRYRFGRRLSIAFGNAIPCPSCTYNLRFIKWPEEKMFQAKDRFTIDWRTTAELSRKDGSFFYIPKPLVKIRLHAGSETVKTMEEQLRQKEELDMFRLFHTEPVARLLMHFYRSAGEAYGK